MTAPSLNATKGIRYEPPQRPSAPLSPHNLLMEHSARLAFPTSLVLTPISRSPTTLDEATVKAVLRAPLPEPAVRQDLKANRGNVTRLSILIVTFENLVFNRLCLESLLASINAVDYEVIVVDNASTDGTREYLMELERRQPHLRTIVNPTNRGFAAANNQALAIAAGEAILLLNNDTIVPPRWLERLLRYLDDDGIGLVGAVTNRCGNEAQVETSYNTLGEMADFAAARASRHAGEIFDIRVATMFCVAMRRAVFDEIGPLDEQFGVGLFEDDDYSMRVRAAGYRVVCADDFFVHHFAQASLGKLAAAGQYGDLFHANRRLWEAKWQRMWQSHGCRPNSRYERQKQRICQVVKDVIPAATSVLVISKGDDDLLASLRVDGIIPLHFPQALDGCYAGYYPADSVAVIAHLEHLRNKGAAFLLIPDVATWWLNHYAGFHRHLDKSYSVSAKDASCIVFDLRRPLETAERSVPGS